MVPRNCSWAALVAVSFWLPPMISGVVAARRAGAIHVFDTINHFFGISGMYTVGSIYWNIGLGMNPGDVEKDAEGIRTMEALGANMAWILKKIASG